MTIKIIQLFLLVLFLSSTAFSQNKEPEAENLQVFYKNLANVEISEINHNKQTKLKDLKANTLIVVFLASWCNPCVSQAEEVNRIKEEFSKFNLQAIGISADIEDRKDLNSKFNYILGELSESQTISLIGDLVKITKVDAIPYTILINNGEIKEIFVGAGSTTQKKLRENLKEIYSKSINESNNRTNQYDER